MKTADCKINFLKISFGSNSSACQTGQATAGSRTIFPKEPFEKRMPKALYFMRGLFELSTAAIFHRAGAWRRGNIFLLPAVAWPVWHAELLLAFRYDESRVSCSSF